jgi:hypothetical protein
VERSHPQVAVAVHLGYEVRGTDVEEVSRGKAEKPRSVEALRRGPRHATPEQNVEDDSRLNASARRRDQPPWTSTEA